MTTVTHVHGIAGAAQATGAAIVIDTFRAFTTAAVLFDASISRTDHREIAGTWVRHEIEPGTKIAIEHYSIPFDPVDFLQS